MAMCGISGIVYRDFQRQVEPSRLRAMTSIMKFRGPDSEGYHHDPGVGLGMCRLSIIDTASGDQPIGNEDDSITVICNGEIYNYIELRDRLTALGHRFRTESDVEVIVHAYEEEPNNFWERLRGMFAIALWDRKRQRLLLVRDRLGIKPLHYALTPDGLIFGSELKTVMASGLFQPELDRAALREVHDLGCVLSPKTLVKQVRRLAPGSWMSYSREGPMFGRYWDVTFPAASDVGGERSKKQWTTEFQQLLETSVKLHMRSDVPVGAFLSAGIDSSAVTALACQHTQTPIHTFSVGFDDPVADELRNSKLLDQYGEFPLNGHRCQCSREHLQLLPEVIWHREQPNGWAVGLACYQLAELAASEVKTVLAGEGSDEVLGGYSWYRANKILAPFSNLPRPLRDLLGRLLVWDGRWPGAGRILMAPSEMNLRRFQAYIGRPSWKDMIGLVSDASDGLEERRLPVPPAFQHWSSWHQLQYLDLKVRMVEHIIPSLDRYSMAHSVEARVPFLDHKLVEFCCKIPPSVLMPWFKEKFVLREAMRGILPEPIRRRPKFAMTGSADWLVGTQPNFVREQLSKKSIVDKGLFDWGIVSSILREQKDGAADHRSLINLILGSQIWADQFLGGDRF